MRRFGPSLTIPSLPILTRIGESARVSVVSIRQSFGALGAGTKRAFDRAWRSFNLPPFTGAKFKTRSNLFHRKKTASSWLRREFDWKRWLRFVYIPSFCLAVAFLILIILEQRPATGAFLDSLGGDSLVGWVGQVVLLALLFDALRGAAPRAAALVPLVFYGSYYLALWRQDVHIALESEALRKTNPTEVLLFDPNHYSLVANEAERIAVEYSIPVVYSYDTMSITPQYISYRLVERTKVRTFLSRNSHDVQVKPVYLDDGRQANVMELEYPESPKRTNISVIVRDNPGDGWRDWNIGLRKTTLSLDGRVIGEFRSAYAFKLSPVPLFEMNCQTSPVDGKRTCTGAFRTSRISIESRPDSVDWALYDDPVSVMLGIKRRSNAELAESRGPDQDISRRPAPGEDEAFDALRDAVDGRSSLFSSTAEMQMADNPARLAAFGDGMAKRFLELAQGETNFLGRRRQASVLAVGLTALGPGEFASVQGTLSVLARNDELRSAYPLLYLRLADSGPSLFSIYRDQFLAPGAPQSVKLMAALAICRIGQADSELTSAMLSQWTQSESREVVDENYRAALFVALAKLGQENALRASGRAGSKTLASWYDAVLAGRGRTNVGPNNCMPMEWPGDGYVPPFMAPRLQWTQQQWRVAE